MAATMSSDSEMCFCVIFCLRVGVKNKIQFLPPLCECRTFSDCEKRLLLLCAFKSYPACQLTFHHSARSLVPNFTRVVLWKQLQFHISLPRKNPKVQQLPGLPQVEMKGKRDARKAQKFHPTFCAFEHLQLVFDCCVGRNNVTQSFLTVVRRCTIEWKIKIQTF